MNTVFPVLLESASRAFAAAAVVWCALHLLRVRNVRTQKTAWTLTLLGAVAMPLLMRFQPLPVANEITVPSFSRILVSTSSWLRVVVHPSAPATPAAPAENGTPIPPPSAWSRTTISDRSATQKISRADSFESGLGNEFASLPLVSAPASLQSDFVAPQPASAAPLQTPALRLNDVAWLVYLAVAATLLLRLLVGLISALRVWMTADPVLSPATADLAPAGRVRWSPRVNSPANLGSGIVLPADYGEWSTEKLRIVLAHEYAHLRQRDFYLQLLADLYAALVWFSPLGWWLKRRLSELGEAMSDCAGLEEAASPSSYAQTLLEFAALPRPTQTGVAMARTSHLAFRIERLLNDSAFRQAFTGSRRRAVLALAIAPLALLASASLVRVQAAGQTMAPSQQSGLAQMIPASQESGVSTPPAQTGATQDQQAAPAPAPASPSPAAAPQAEPSSPGPQAPAPAPAPQAVPAPEAAPAPDVMPGPPVPPAPGAAVVEPFPPMPELKDLNKKINAAVAAQMKLSGVFPDHFNWEGGDPWALVPAQGEPQPGHISGDDRDDIEQARKTAHTPFFWFKHDGKSFVIDDPTVVAQIESMQKPIEDLRSQMRDLRKQQRAVGEQMRQQMREQRQTSIPKPDLSKQMADLNAAVDSLKSSQGDTVTREQLRKLQEQLGQLQGQIARAESGFYKQNGQWGAAMGEFGRQMGKLGGEQGRLAGEMARMSVANHGKIEAIIEQSLKDGKAKAVK